jgi:1-acyl-sn-glycerol-3-phosphate acyltransferase
MVGILAQPRIATRTSRWVMVKGMLRGLAIAFPTVWEGLTGRFDKARFDARMQDGCRGMLDDAGIRLRVEGAEHMRTGAIYVSNHISAADIPVAGAVVPGLRMLAKAGLFRIPVWGYAMKASGFVAIDRGHRARAIASLKQVIGLLRTGVNVWIFAEGTRSRDGQLQPFKKGGFVTAIEAGATIVPVTLAGTYEVIPPKSRSVCLGQPVTIRFHPPIDASRYTLDDRDRLMADVRRAIVSAPIRGEPVAPRC